MEANSYTDAVVVLSWTEKNKDTDEAYVMTKVFRLEFESLEAAERWLDAGTEDHSIMNYTALADENGD